MAREFTVIIEQDEEGYFVGSVPELWGCHTQARSLDELIERIKEAIQLCLAAEGEPEEPSPRLVGIQGLSVWAGSSGSGSGGPGRGPGTDPREELA
jgi:predicted RNase H-like HicB family nuclease